MKKTEIIKKYIDIYGKRPALNIDKKLSEDEKLKYKQEIKINQFIWSLKKQIFVEAIEKSKLTSDNEKIKYSKDIVDRFTLNDLMKIFYGYQYNIDYINKTYILFQD